MVGALSADTSHCFSNFLKRVVFEDVLFCLRFCRDNHRFDLQNGRFYLQNGALELQNEALELQNEPLGVQKGLVSIRVDFGAFFLIFLTILGAILGSFWGHFGIIFASFF